MIAVRSQPLFATRLSKRAIYERNISRCMPVASTLSRFLAEGCGRAERQRAAASMVCISFRRAVNRRPIREGTACSVQHL